MSGESEIDECLKAFEIRDKKRCHESLLQLSSPAKVRGKLNQTLLHLSARNGWYDVSKLLTTKYLCDPFSEDDNGYSVLHYACTSGNLDLVMYFIREWCLDPLKKSANNGITPLDISSREGHSTIVEYLKGVIDLKSQGTGDMKDSNEQQKMSSAQNNNEESTLISTDSSIPHIEAFKEAVARKSLLTYYITQCMPFGPPRVGKTCLYHCLLNRKPPGKPTTREELGSGPESTSILTKRRMIQVKIHLESKRLDKAIVAEGCQWNEISTMQDEIALYIKAVYSQKKLHQTFSASPLPGNASKRINLELAEQSTMPSSVMHFNTKEDDISNDSSSHSTVQLDDAILNAITDHVKHGEVDLAEVHHLLDKSLTIFYTDTGGQPEFQEVLPALVAGPMIFMLVFNLSEPLEKVYEVQYAYSQNEYESYESTFTVKEVLMQCLSSIVSYHQAQLCHCSHVQHHAASKYSKITPPPTKILVVGTHSDLVSEEDVAKIDKAFQAAVADTVLEYEGMIEYYKEDMLVIPINNYDPLDGGKVRDVFDRAVKRKIRGVSPYKVELPVHWLGMELYLRQQESSVVSYKNCLEIGMKLGMQEEELSSCLWYLHHRMGTIRHYGGLEYLQDIVITEPSVLFHAVTEFITSTFTLKNVEKSVKRSFQSLGLFRTSEVEHIFNRHKDRLQIPFHKFIALLQHLNILGPAHDEDYDYFLPCALAHAPPLKVSEQKEQEYDPLLASFSGGFVPKGLFSGVLAKCCIGGWKIKRDRTIRRKPLLFCNQATFVVDGHSVTMAAKAKHLEFLIELSSTDDVSSVFCRMRDILKKAIEGVLEGLGYVSNFKFGFYCTIPECEDWGEHFAAVTSESCAEATCSITQGVFRLDQKRSIWFLPSHSKPDALAIKIKQITNRTNEPDFHGAQGIIFIVGIYGADGTAKDVENVETTFKQLNFATFLERDPTSTQIASLINAAAACKYPDGYKYIAFYFAGHGEREESTGKLFINGLQLNKAKPEILYIEEFIVDPLQRLKGPKKLLFFDCCQTLGSDTAYHGDNTLVKNPKPLPNVLLAFSASKGQKSFGDKTKGGIWTYYLCKNLKKKRSITAILNKTSKDVRLLRKEFQEPQTFCLPEFDEVILQRGMSIIEKELSAQNIINHLKTRNFSVGTHWILFVRLLGLSLEELASCKKSYSYINEFSEPAFEDFLTLWLTNDHECSWEKVDAVIYKLENDRLKKRYDYDINTEIVAAKKEKIKTLLMNKHAQGILFAVWQANSEHVENIKSTFEDLDFVVHSEPFCSSLELVSLIIAASESEYPINFNYISFYFTGHGGANDLGKPVIEQLTNKHELEILNIGKYLMQPLRNLNLTRLFLFDCSLFSPSTISNIDALENIKSTLDINSDEILAFAINMHPGCCGQWTNFFCANLKKRNPILKIFDQTAEQYMEETKNSKQPICVHNLKRMVILQKDVFGKAFKEAIETGEYFSCRMAHCMPFGPPHVGKTHLYHCLLNKKYTDKRSTPVSESKGIVKISHRESMQEYCQLHTAVVNVDVSETSDYSWEEYTGLAEEIATYMKSIQTKSFKADCIDGTTNTSQVHHENADSKPKESNNASVKRDGNSKKSMVVDNVRVENTTGQTVNASNALTEALITSATDNAMNEVSSSEDEDDVIFNATGPAYDVNIEEKKVLLGNSITLFFSDTGGQPSFQEVLPALVSGPSIFFLVFDLRKSLDSKYEINFKTASPNDFRKYDSAFTVRQVLLQCLQSIHSYCKRSSGGETNSPVNVLVIGTHKDKVKVKNIEEIKLSFQKSIGTPGFESVFKDGNFLIDVNNNDPKDGELVRKRVENIITRGKNEFKVEIPISWLGLQFYLRNREKPTISYIKCMNIAKKFCITEENLPFCLRYLHYKAGTIRYYENESLEQIVITKPGVLLNAVSKLIEKTFPTIDVGVNTAVCGFFKESIIEEEIAEPLGLSKEYLIAFFKHLNIIAPANHIDKGFDYFLPCALVHAEPVPESEDAKGIYEPLLVTFGEGFIPLGFFSGLLVSLCIEKWMIIKHPDTKKYKLFRNQAFFSAYVPESDSSSFKCVVKKFCGHIEFRIIDIKPSNQLCRACCYIKELLDKNVSDVCYKLQYEGEWKFGVYCPSNHGSTTVEDHFAEVFKEKNQIQLKCSLNEYVPLQENYWFTNDICGTFKERIKECMQREYKDAQGIIFIISEPNMDPAKKVKSTFENLNFAIFTLDNPDASKVTSLVKEASTCRYPCQYQFIFFYYYGVRGMNASGEFIRPHQEELGIEKSVIEPLRRLNIKRIFLFDYSEHSESNASYKEMNCVHDEAIAIGTEWSEVLCQKLGTSKPIVTVLNEAAEFVAQRGEENKPIVQCCLSDEVSLRKNHCSTAPPSQSGDKVPEDMHSLAVKPREDTDDTIMVVPAEGVDATVLSSDVRTLITVLRATTDVIDWSLLALLIGVAESEYNRIMRENQNDVAGQRKAIIKKWLDTGKATWAILVSGLKDKLVSLAAIGNQIAKDHPTVKPREDADDTIMVEPAKDVDATVLSSDGRTLISVLRATTDVIDWSLLALLIGAAESEYNRIMRENQNDVAGQRNAIIKKWLDTGKATWAILVSGLKDKLVGLAAIGNQIAKDHPRQK